MPLEKPDILLKSAEEAIEQGRYSNALHAINGILNGRRDVSQEMQTRATTLLGRLPRPAPPPVTQERDEDESASKTFQETAISFSSLKRTVPFQEVPQEPEDIVETLDFLEMQKGIFEAVEFLLSGEDIQFVDDKVVRNCCENIANSRNKKEIKEQIESILEQCRLKRLPKIFGKKLLSVVGGRELISSKECFALETKFKLDDEE